MADERHDWFLNQIFRHQAALHRYLRKFTSGAEDAHGQLGATANFILRQGTDFEARWEPPPHLSLDLSGDCA
jgi:hypothetical protein